MASQLTQITIKIPAPAFGSHNSKSTRFKSRNNTGISFIVILLFTLLNLHNDFNGNWMTTMMPMLCMAGPMPTSLVLPPTSQSADSSMVRVVNLTRQHGGDIFTAFDTSKCNVDICVGLSSGTASMNENYNGNNNNNNNHHNKDGSDGIDEKNQQNLDDCKCQCLPHLDAFREDLNICVDDIHECTLAPFVSGSSLEKIPFVFLPLRGQIIHPSKEISFQGIKQPICAVSGSQYLTTAGWTELRNTIDLDIPFRLFRDEGRTFLQWLGESDLRFKMQGRLILVHLMCRDMAIAQPIDPIIGNDNDLSDRLAIKSTKPAQGIFTPCVAFRVAGMPIKHINNVTEVSFQLESTSSTLASMDGLSAKEYFLIAACSLLLGLAYVVSVFLYIHVKRYKARASNGGQDGPDGVQRKSDYQQNDEVTFGNGFNRSSYDRSSGSMTGGNGGGVGGGLPSDRHKNLNRNMSLNGLGNEEQGVIKNNPLLKHYPNLSDNSGFISDMSNSNSDCGEEHISAHELLKNMQNSMHAQNSMGKSQTQHDGNEHSASSPTQETECLPEENVSIIEDMTTEDKLENMKAIVSGTMRRKLYFNPAYFEPHLLMSPPPAAIEFLTKIREVITLAKYKMATKRFQPSLTMIPEEHQNAYANSSMMCSKSMLQANMGKSDKKSSCVSCSGCVNEKIGVNCKNCGEKRNSIRKWLEGVSKHETNTVMEEEAEDDDAVDDDDGGDCSMATVIEQKLAMKMKMNAMETVISTIEVNNGNSPQSMHSKINDGGSSSDSDTVKANSLGSKNSKKRKAPPIPSTAPKIISHFLKKDIKAMQHRPPPPPQPMNPAPMLKTEMSVENGKPLSNNSNNSNNISSKTTATKSSALQLKTKANLLDKNDIYNGLSLVGSEIYNNPQFMLSSPSLSHRSKSDRNSNAIVAAAGKKRIDVLDQYANPAQLIQENMVKKLQNIPDMVYEAIAKDTNNTQVKVAAAAAATAATATSVYGHLNVPTPDYDDPNNSTYSRRRARAYENDETLIPPPDYNSNTLGRKQYQPDSPIYHRKSPHYLIVDYETDSLERTNTNKTAFTPHSNNSSDLSSQPSPSLSSALPLEEEVEIGNTVYDRVEGYRKDGDPMKVIRNFPKKAKPPSSVYEEIGGMSIAKAYLQSSRSSDYGSHEPRIKYNTPFHGSMTIEVEHEPTDDELSTDSDQFEPDTLDRKPKKFNNMPKLPTQPPPPLKPKINGQFPHIPNNQRNVNDWPNRRGNKIGSNRDYHDSNLSSLPDMSYFNNNSNNNGNNHPNSNSSGSSSSNNNNIFNNNNNNNSNNNISNSNNMVLRSSGSFRSNSLGNYLSEIGALMNNNDLEKSFSSLREIYEAKNHKNLKQRPGLNENEYDGRLLTLEARHSRRQRQTTLEKNMKKILPPDIIPTDAQNIYEMPMNLGPTANNNSKSNNNNSKNNEKNAQKNLMPSIKDDLVYDQNNKKKTNKDHSSSGGSSGAVSPNVKDPLTSPTKKHNLQNHVDDDMHLISESLSTSSTSESTDLTGVSDTQPNSGQNSLKQAYSQVRKTAKCSGVYNLEARRASELQNNPKYMNLSDVHSLRPELQQQQHQHQNQQQLQQQSDCNSDSSTLKTGSTKFYYKSNLNQEANLNTHFGAPKEDLDKIEIISSKSLRLKDIDLQTAADIIVDSGTKHLISELANDTSTLQPQLQQLAPTKVFHVDISPPTNGMQIALGIRDRVKKSKDLKHAWKKFVNMATSKFQGGSGTTATAAAHAVQKADTIRGEYDLVDKTATFSDSGDRDDGIASMSTCDENMTPPSNDSANKSIEILSRSPSNSSSDMVQKPNKTDMDYGYISADSNESKAHKRNLYARFNFKMDKTADQKSNVEPSTSRGGGTAVAAAAASNGNNALYNDRDWRQKHLHRMQEIKENSESDRNSVSSAKTITKTITKPMISAPISATVPIAQLLDFIPNNNLPKSKSVDSSAAAAAANTTSTVNVRIYSSSDDDERYSSGMSSESDGEYNADELCESGAESIETHSVLFKNIRKLNENN